MDIIESAYLIRARTALDMLGAAGPNTAERAKAFVTAAIEVARARDPESARSAMERSPDPMVTKAAAHSTIDAVWQGQDMQALAAGFLASMEEPDLLSAIRGFGRDIPRGASHVLVATGAVGDTTLEGFPKLIRRLDLSVGPDLAFSKSTAAIAVSRELLTALGNAGRRLFENELTKAMVRACNAAIVARLVDSGTTQIAAGTNPLESLRAGLLAAGPSAGYVVTLPAGWAAWLATSEANRGAGVRGGQFADGIVLVALDDATEMTVIPADRLAVLDGGTELRPAGHASVDMRDSPTSPGEMVSLWQTNCVGLLVERHWRVDGDTSGIVVVGA